MIQYSCQPCYYPFAAIFFIILRAVLKIPSVCDNDAVNESRESQKAYNVKKYMRMAITLTYTKLRRLRNFKYSPSMLNYKINKEKELMAKNENKQIWYEPEGTWTTWQKVISDKIDGEKKLHTSEILLLL